MPKKRIDPDLLIEAKRLYEQTLAPVFDIAGMLGISKTTFNRLVREGQWRGRRARIATFHFARALSGEAVAAMIPEPADQPRAGIEPAPKGPTEEQRLALAQKIYDVVADQIDAIQRIVKVVKAADLTEAEHAARTMAGLSRSLRESKALLQPDNEAPADESDDADPVPRDIDAFRDELSRRIRGIIDARRAGLQWRLDGPPVKPDAG